MFLITYKISFSKGKINKFAFAKTRLGCQHMFLSKFVVGTDERVH